jgi:hypothetical protein
MRINKPRVFLSHSKIDVSFIEKVYSDLQKCQIEPWLDSEEIRHGKPWLAAIFEDGIPTCDAVLVYFTEASLESNMVRKEMDAGILQQLKDKRVAFLPYVNNKLIRTKLRCDIQALQAPVWNQENYSNILTRVVAEIWRSYLERTLESVVQHERVLRLQAELELEKLKKEPSGSIFSTSEEAEFRYLWENLGKMVPIDVEEKVPSVKEGRNYTAPIPIKRHKFDIKLSSLISVIIEAQNEFHSTNLKDFVLDQAIGYLQSYGQGDPKHYYEIEQFPDLKQDLLMYGFIEQIYVPPQSDTPRIFQGFSKYRFIFSNKCYRFRYWLAFNKMLPTSIEFGEVESVDLTVSP